MSEGSKYHRCSRFADKDGKRRCVEFTQGSLGGASFAGLRDKELEAQVEEVQLALRQLAAVESRLHQQLEGFLTQGEDEIPINLQVSIMSKIEDMESRTAVSEDAVVQLLQRLQSAETYF